MRLVKGVWRRREGAEDSAFIAALKDSLRIISKFKGKINISNHSTLYGCKEKPEDMYENYGS